VVVAEEDEAKALAAEKAEAWHDRHAERERLHQSHLANCMDGAPSGRWITAGYDTHSGNYMGELVTLYVAENGEVTGMGSGWGDGTDRPAKIADVVTANVHASTITGNYDKEKWSLSLKQEFVLDVPDTEWTATFEAEGHWPVGADKLEGRLYRKVVARDGMDLSRAGSLMAYRAEKLEEIYEEMLKKVSSFEHAADLLYKWQPETPSGERSTAPLSHQGTPPTTHPDLSRVAYVKKEINNFISKGSLDTYILKNFGVDVKWMPMWLKYVKMGMKHSLPYILKIV
jgi:hypothetical protein